MCLPHPVVLILGIHIINVRENTVSTKSGVSFLNELKHSIEYRGEKNFTGLIH